MTLLLICLSIWIIIWSYNALTGRHFAQDIVPIVVFPIIVLRPIRAIWRWFKTPAHRERTHKPLSWSDLIETASIQRRLLPGREVVLGYNDLNVIYASLDDARHLLITGITGEGKTTIALNIIQSLLMQGPGIFAKMTFSLHDAKNVTALHYKQLSNLYPTHFQIYTQLEDSLAALRGLVDEMLDRARQLGEALLFDIDELGLSHKLILIDEPQLFYRRSVEYERLVLELVTAGRQVGFHVVLLTPYAKSTVISTDYRPNFRYISGFLPKHGEKVVQMPVSTLPRNRFLYQMSERDAAIKFVPYKIRPKDIQQSFVKFSVSKRTGEAIAWYVFSNIPDCGIRTLLKEGRALAEAENPNDIPFPFSEVEGDRWSAAAWNWGQDYLKGLTENGVASEAKPGKARKLLS